MILQCLNMFCVFKKHQNIELSKATRVTVTWEEPGKLSQTRETEIRSGGWGGHKKSRPDFGLKCTQVPAHTGKSPGRVGARPSVVGFSTGKSCESAPNLPEGAEGLWSVVRCHRLFRNPFPQLFFMVKFSLFFKN